MGERCCRSCERWGEQEAEPNEPNEPNEHDELEVSRRLTLVVRGTDQIVEISGAHPVINVGRARDNDIVLRSDNVSRRQMQFVLQDGFVIAIDLKSACGTYVDGRKIGGPVRLRRGAVV